MPRAGNQHVSPLVVRQLGGEYRAQLGESPVWDDDSACLYFVDVCARHVCALDVVPGGGAAAAGFDEDGSVRVVAELPTAPGCIVPSAKGGFLVAIASKEDGTGGKLRRVVPPTRDGSAGSDDAPPVVLSLDDEADASFPSLCDVLNPNTHPKMAEVPRQCLNDGACDAKGRVWVGSKILAPVPEDAYVPVDDASTGALRPNPQPGAGPSGALFCCESAFAFRGGKACAVGAAQAVPEVGGVHVSNGIGWSPDGLVMYYADSPRRCVLAFDFDPNTGVLRGERVFAATDGAVPGGAKGGVPDGLAVDAEGGVWVCLWDAGAVVRYVPGGDGGVVDRVVKMPCSRPTSACFGGGAFATTLFITTCSRDTTVDEHAESLTGAEPLAGAVFSVDVGVAGVPVHKAAF